MLCGGEATRLGVLREYTLVLWVEEELAEALPPPELAGMIDPQPANASAVIATLTPRVRPRRDTQSFMLKGIYADKVNAAGRISVNQTLPRIYGIARVETEVGR